MKVTYPISRLENTKNNLGFYFDYAINTLGITPSEITQYFITSSVSKEIERGNPRYIDGKSGVELVLDTMFELNKSVDYNKDFSVSNTSKEYWAGLALAYLQWGTNRSFSDILSQITFQEVIDLYHPYHEMDLRKLLEHVYQNYFLSETNIKKFRRLHNLTQKELAIKVGVSKRTIESYESRENDINKAQGIILFNLSRILHCEMEELLE